jgi:eukaryotic-like serine/threonine-protein kinase
MLAILLIEALKVFFPEILGNANSKKRFIAEMSMCSSITHPNVVRAYEPFDLPGYTAYAMEYVNGGDLAGRMRAKNINLSEAISFINDAAQGLQAIHEQNIVHRDLKPENMLLSKQGILKISDFGLARTDTSSTLTNVGSMVGTPQYISPEYIEFGECDRRADIFALGVIAYEMLTGQSPWGPGSGIHSLANRNYDVLPNVRDNCPYCPERLAKIVNKAMSVNLNQRYQSAEEMLQDLIRV